MNIPEQPYERFCTLGAGSLTNAELLAIILRTGTTNMSAVALSKEILAMKNSDGASLSVLFDLTMKDLLSIRGIGEVKAVKILSLAELVRRITGEALPARGQFCSPSEVASCYMEKLRHHKVETALLLLLDNRLSLIGEHIISIGTVNCALLSSREIYIKALENNAVNIMLLHNHPSGDCTPSSEDISVTEKIRLAGEVVGIPLTDHIIIGDGIYYSMKEAGYIK